MPILTTLLLGPVNIERDPWHFVDFLNIFQPNTREDQTKSYHLSAEPLGLCRMVNSALFIALRSQKGWMRPEVATFRTKTLNFMRVIHLNWLAKFELRGPVPPCQYHFQLLLYVKKTCTRNKGVPLPAGKAYTHYSIGL